jgi:branched-chain amino acid transport system substrate-binding protein
MRSFNNIGSWIACAAVSGLLAGGCANQTPNNAGGGSAPPTSGAIIVGEYGSMTGDQSTFGVSTDHGVQLAITDIDKAGGINGHPLSVMLHDDEGKSDKTTTVATLLATQDKPTAVIGEVASGRSTIAAPVFNAAKIPMISPSSTNPKVTTIGPYIFRVCFIDPFQGTVAAKFAIQDLHAKKAAIMTDSTNQYSLGLSEYFAKSFTAQGGTIVKTANYTGSDATFESQLTEIKGVNPDILYVPGYYNNIGPIAKQARQVGLTVPLLGGDGWDSPKLIEGAGGPGGALEGSYFTDHYSVDNPDPHVQNFVTEYKTSYGAGAPDALAALGYDAVGVLAAAMKSIPAPADGNYDSDDYRSKLRDAIAATKGYVGVTGIITLDADRNAVKPAVVLQIHGAGYVYKTTIAP